MVKLTCIMCPVGCSLEVSKKNGEIVVTGNNCIRGERYGKQEVISPTRMVTTVCKTTTGYVSVKTTAPVDKAKVQNVVAEIGKLTLSNPKHGDIIIKNVLGTGADIVVTSGR